MPLRNKFTPDMNRWLQDHVHGRLLQETYELFQEQFKVPHITTGMFNHQVYNILHLKTGVYARYTKETNGIVTVGSTTVDYHGFVDNQFKKGHIPHNKGVKGVIYEGCKKTWFKKGDIPPNHRPVGSRRVTRDGYRETKVAEPNVWKLDHRIAWEQVHGQVPHGYCIIFLDGNSLNCNIDNLELVSRAENLVMNRAKLSSNVPELTHLGVLVARYYITAYDKLKQKKESRKHEKQRQTRSHSSNDQ